MAHCPASLAYLASFRLGVRLIKYFWKKKKKASRTAPEEGHVRFDLWLLYALAHTRS